MTRGTSAFRRSLRGGRVLELRKGGLEQGEDAVLGPRLGNLRPCERSHPACLFWILSELVLASISAGCVREKFIRDYVTRDEIE